MLLCVTLCPLINVQLSSKNPGSWRVNCWNILLFVKLNSNEKIKHLEQFSSKTHKELNKSPLDGIFCSSWNTANLHHQLSFQQNQHFSREAASQGLIETISLNDRHSVCFLCPGFHSIPIKVKKYNQINVVENYICLQ